MTMWEQWQEATIRYAGFRVVGLIPAYGVFELRQTALFRVFEGTRNTLSTVRLATPQESGEVDYAIARGWLQLEIRPVRGVIGGQGGQGVSSMLLYPRVLFPARGISEG